jgi:hypothetical protein
MAEKIPQGLKPIIYFVAFAARLKPCPDTKLAQFRVFPQPVKSCPDTKTELGLSIFRSRYSQYPSFPAQISNAIALGVTLRWLDNSAYPMDPMTLSLLWVVCQQARRECLQAEFIGLKEPADLFLRIDRYKSLTLWVIPFLPVDPAQEFLEVELSAEFALAEIPGLMRFIQEGLYDGESFQQILHRQFLRLPEMALRRNAHDASD